MGSNWINNLKSANNILRSTNMTTTDDKHDGCLKIGEVNTIEWTYHNTLFIVGLSINGKNVGPNKNVGVKTTWTLQPNE
jgi:hypothetical protein